MEDTWSGLRTRLWTTPFLFYTFLGIVLLLFSTVVLQLPRALASPAWPSVQGVILTSEVREVGWSEDTSGWCPELSYEYPVAGRKYVSHNVELQDICISNLGSFARRVVERYPAGKRVEVYYDPRDPARAVLEPGVPDAVILWPLLVIAATGLGIILVVVGLLGLLGVVKFPESRGPS